MVGVNWTRTEGRLPFRTEICSGETTASCSSVSGCSGSEMERIRSAKGVGCRQYHPSLVWVGDGVRHNRAATREMSNQRTKDLVLIDLVSGRAVVPLQAGIAPREFEGVRFVLELVTESIPREVIVGGEVEVGDADAAGAARRRVDCRIRVVGRRVDHLVQV